MLGAAVVTAIAGPLVEPVVHVAVLVGVVVMEGPLLRSLGVQKHHPFFAEYCCVSQPNPARRGASQGILLERLLAEAF